MAYGTWTDDHNNVYSEPYIPKKIVGFHGIDPDLVPSGAGNNGIGVLLTHEELGGLYGGEESGHRHLTEKEYNQLMELLNIDTIKDLIDERIQKYMSNINVINGGEVVGK